MEYDHSHYCNKTKLKTEIDSRIFGLQAEIQKVGLDGALIIQNADLYYYAATIQQAHLYIPSKGAALLMVRKSISRAKSESPIEQIVSLSSTKQMVSLLDKFGYGPPKRLGLELDVLPVNLYRSYRKLFGDIDYTDISPIIRGQRAIKSEDEIERIRRACKFSDKIASYASCVLEPDITEVEYAGLIEAESRRLGHQGTIRMRGFNTEIFYGHLMSGPCAAEPSFLNSATGGRGTTPAIAQSAGMRKIQCGEPVMVDYVFGYDGYLSDHARVHSIGPIEKSLILAHEAMLDVQSMIIAEAGPGVTCSDLYKEAMSMVERKRLAPFFMGSYPDQASFIGHGIGLEVNELPVIGKDQHMILEPNMVFALEPKAVFKDKGTVGIENMFLVTLSGLERLTNASDRIWVS